jgi:molybdate transport system regulatory protein
MTSSAKAAEIVTKLYLRSGRVYVFGPGKAELMERIQETGSISEAAKKMAMSYMRAWQLVKGMNKAWREPLVTTARGGAKRGGAMLTTTGIEVLRLYRELAVNADAATKSSAKKFTALMK